MYENLRRIPEAVEISGADIAKGRLKLRRGFSYLFVRAALKGRRPDRRILAKIARYDPLIIVRLPFTAIRVAADRRPDAKRW